MSFFVIHKKSGWSTPNNIQAGNTPKETTSASESSCLPISDVALIMRATKPSRKSKTMAANMHVAERRISCCQNKIPVTPNERFKRVRMLGMKFLIVFIVNNLLGLQRYFEFLKIKFQNGFFIEWVSEWSKKEWETSFKCSHSHFSFPEIQRMKGSHVLYPGPGSNRHEVTLIGFWDQRVYQFRHPGIEYKRSLQN